MDLKDRTRAARLHADLTQEELVERVRRLPGVESFSQQALNKLETGASKKSAYLPHIAHICGVNPLWLATGLGAMGITTEPLVVQSAKGLRKDILSDAIETVEAVLRDAGLSPLPEEKTDLIMLVYDDALEDERQGKPLNRDKVRNFVKGATGLRKVAR